MFWHWGKKNKRVKDLRKEQGFTARELAQKAKVDTIDIMKIDELRLKDVPPSLKKKIESYVTGEYTNKFR
jgi:transcriptional regulator with XRE-family HTH domain